jgi:hypothetical protein
METLSPQSGIDDPSDLPKGYFQPGPKLPGPGASASGTTVAQPDAAPTYTPNTPATPQMDAGSSNENTSDGLGGGKGMGNPIISAIGSTMVSNIEAVSKVVSLNRPHMLPSLLARSAGDSTDPTIKFYLGKPTKVVTGNLSTTDVAGTFPNYGVFDALKTNPLYYNKLVGSFAFRADTVVTLQVNANRFQAGRYILAYLPTGGAYTADTAWADYIRMKKFSAVQITQLLHTELDLATDTQVQLRIPYTCFANSTPVATSAGSFQIMNPGIFFLYPYMALLAGSSASTASYVMWVHYENITVMGNMAPQMGFNDPGRGSSGAILNKGKEAIGLEVLKPGPVETIANKIRGVADAVSTVPVLSAFAGPVSWLSDIFGGVCSVFGWSKPIQIEPVNLVKYEMFHSVGNCDTKDPVTSLSLIENNHIDVLPGFAGTNNDELSINYLKSIYAYYDVYDWTDTQTAGDLIFQLDLAPTKFHRTDTDSATKILSPTPICWLSTYFSQYRGGLKFRFKFVKTEFHSGRLIFGFFPFDPMLTLSPAGITYANLDYVQKTVVDIRDSNTFELEVPYVSTTPYKPLGTPEAGTSEMPFGYSSPFGTLACWVLSDLVAPEGVTSEVKILTEVAGASDLEFACPRDNVFAPIIPLNVALAPQMGDFDGNTNLGEVGQTASKPMEYQDAACCVGEGIVSMRQLLKRPNTFLSYSNNKYMVVRPQAITPLINVTTTGPVANGLSLDLYTMLGCTFTYYRGGIRLKIMPSTMSTVNQSLINVNLYKALNQGGTTPHRTNMSSASTSAAINANLRSNYKRGSNIALSRFDWGLGLNIPFYSNTHSKPTLMAYSTSTLSTRYSWSPQFAGSMDLEVVFTCDTADTLSGSYLRYGADDCNFGLFNGVPPIYRFDYS